MCKVNLRNKDRIFRKKLYDNISIFSSLCYIVIDLNTSDTNIDRGDARE